MKQFEILRMGMGMTKFGLTLYAYSSYNSLLVIQSLDNFAFFTIELDHLKGDEHQ